MIEPRIPYITIPELPIIPGSGSFEGITIKPFGALVALGVYLGWRVAARQGRRLGFDMQVFESFVGWVVGAGFIGGHVFDVLLYHSSHLSGLDPLQVLIDIVAIWRSQSSFGGFMGATIGLFIWKRRNRVDEVLPYADTVASGFPLGWMFGRTGCSVAHDHPGMISDAWFAVRDYGGPGLPARFDLGLIEMALTIPLAMAFLFLMRKPRPWGFYLGWMATIYAPERFLLDFLRARDKARGVGDVDPRHLGLTPAQWLCIALLIVGIYFLQRAYRAQAAGEAPEYLDEPDLEPTPANAPRALFEHPTSLPNTREEHSMDILHVASELAPYAKVGGLADVVAALPKNLRLLGHKLTVALPRHRALVESGLPMARRLTPLTFELGAKPITATLFDAKLASGVELVLVDIAGAFDREGVYGEGGRDYDDNPQRFAAFSRAVVEFTRQRAQSRAPFAVVHAHDWPTALVPYYLKKLGPERPATVLTVHNLAHQGIVPRERVPELAIAWEDFHMDGVEFFGSANILKAGLMSADALTTVSETYARDILTPEHGAKLDGLLRKRAADLTGIVNGVDSSVWNPATDGALVARYDVEDITNKTRCKVMLLAELGLELAPERPLAVFVGRLVAQKGADLVLAALAKLLAAEFSIAIAGGGDPSIERKLEQAAAKHPGQVVFTPSPPEPVVHRLFGGADFVLVPSRFEPCGLVQLYAQRYGAIPIGHATGGLRDTIVDCDAALETGTGFLFDEPSATSLAGASQRARSAFALPQWRSLVRRVMRLERGWERPARRYEQVYRKLVG